MQKKRYIAGNVKKRLLSNQVSLTKSGVVQQENHCFSCPDEDATEKCLYLEPGFWISDFPLLVVTGACGSCVHSCIDPT